MRFRDIPIQRKLMTMILGTSGAVLLLTCAAFVGYELLTYRQNAVRELVTLGAVFAAQSTGALAFDNERDATENLSFLKVEPHIMAGALYDRQGRLFARYPEGAPDSTFPTRLPADGSHFVGNHLVTCTPVVQVQDRERFGTLYLKSDMEAMYDRVRLYGGIAALVIVVSSLIAYLLSRVLQRGISRPIRALAETARAVSNRRDYSVRATKHGEDELGVLTDAFNHMLAQIEEQNAQLERRVLERTAELEAANDELEAFCSSAAHDLRTPLRAIAGFAEVLLDRRADDLPPDAKRYIGLIHAGSGQMGQLIQDLLSFSRLGRQEISRQSVPLEQLCRDALRDFEAEPALRRARISIGPLPTVFADAALLRVVFVNLLSNALKYSRAREPAVIDVGVTQIEGEVGPVIFVRDNGVGFDLANAEKLFGVFQRLHHAHEFEGTGVGLATVRRIVERHHGRIWAEAELDRGATFFFTIPSA